MIAIATTVFDLDGSFVLTQRDATIVFGTQSRRSSKSKTLDGGVSVYDTGFSQGDREFRVSLNNPTEALVNQIATLMEQHSTFRIACTKGAFIAGLSSLDESSSGVTFNISIEEKVS